MVTRLDIKKQQTSAFGPVIDDELSDALDTGDMEEFGADLDE